MSETDLDKTTAIAIIKARVQMAAQNAGTTLEFFWRDMNYRSLVTPFRELMRPDEICLNCGRPFENALAIEIGYRYPPRHEKDFARLHTRNVFLACSACIIAKANKEYDDWLREQWD